MTQFSDIDMYRHMQEALAAKAANRLGYAAQECSILGFVRQYQHWIAKLLPTVRGHSSIQLRTSCWGTLGMIYSRSGVHLPLPDTVQ